MFAFFYFRAVFVRWWADVVTKALRKKLEFEEGTGNTGAKQ